MRERLIELLKGAETKVTEIVSPPLELGEWLGIYADYLLENGVIVPPCKVKTTVYSQKGCFFLPYEKDINPKEVIPCEVLVIKETKKGKYILLKPLLIETYGMRNANEWFPFSAIGKTVFLTREEAEAKLKEGVQE